jgi:uncharacterized Tic20 family protein
MDETPKPPELATSPPLPSTASGPETDTYRYSSNSETGGIPTPSEKQWAVALHLSALLGFVIPFFNLVAPLIIWLFKRPVSSWLDVEGKRVLNFQISFTIYALIIGLSIFILIGLILLPILGIIYLAFLIVGAIRASEGVRYSFPLTIKFLPERPCREQKL